MTAIHDFNNDNSVELVIMFPALITGSYILHYGIIIRTCKIKDPVIRKLWYNHECMQAESQCRIFTTTCTIVH